MTKGERGREVAAAALVALLALAVVLLVAAIGGVGLTYNDEYVYAAAARELAQGKPPWCFAPWCFFVARLGFPYPEIHARGAIATIAVAFKLFGATERAAVAPAVLFTVLLAVGFYAAARWAGIGRKGAVLAGVLAGAYPIDAVFATTTFPEAGHDLGYVLAAAAIVAPGGGLRALLLVLGTFLAVVHRETATILPVGAALGLLVHARTSGASWRDALRGALPAPALAFAAGLVAFALVKGPMLDPNVRGWYVLLPACEGDEGLYGIMDTGPAPLSPFVVLKRVWNILPAFFVGGDGLEGTLPIVLLVHACALAALAVAWRSRDAVARALGASGAFLYAVKAATSLVFHEPPGLFARHLGAEGVVCFLAAVVWFARSGRGALAAAAVALVFSLGTDVVIARGHAHRLESQRRLARVVDALCPPTGGVLCSENAGRLAWERPGQFVLLPPWTEATLEKVTRVVPVDRLELDVWEPLVARPLQATGRVPERIGAFRLARRDASLGPTLLVYERVP